MATFPSDLQATPSDHRITLQGTKYAIFWCSEYMKGPSKPSPMGVPDMPAKSFMSRYPENPLKDSPRAVDHVFRVQVTSTSDRELHRISVDNCIYRCYLSKTGKLLCISGSVRVAVTISMIGAISAISTTVATGAIGLGLLANWEA